MSLKVAGVGAGYFSHYHYDAWQRIGCVDVVAICDRDLMRAHSTAKRHGIPLVFDQFSTMLNDTGPDIIDIITPPESHEELLGIALAANAAIICQKPLAPTLADARRMVAMAEAKDRRFFVHENFRFQPWYVEIKALLDRHAIGTPYSVSFRLRPGDGQGPNAYLSRQPYFQRMERFLVHETGVHFIDTYRYLFGEVKRVYADLHRLNPHICGEDAGIILFEFEKAGRGVLDANRLSDHQAVNTRLTMGDMLIEGAEGVLRLDGNGRLFSRAQGGVEREHEYSWSDEGFAGDSVYACQSHLVACVEAGKSSPISAREYLRNLEIEEAIYESSRTGVRISV